MLWLVWHDDIFMVSHTMRQNILKRYNSKFLSLSTDPAVPHSATDLHSASTDVPQSQPVSNFLPSRAVTMRLTSVALESPRFVFSLRKPVGLGIPSDPTSIVTRLAVYPAS